MYKIIVINILVNGNIMPIPIKAKISPKGVLGGATISGGSAVSEPSSFFDLWSQVSGDYVSEAISGFDTSNISTANPAKALQDYFNSGQLTNASNLTEDSFNYLNALFNGNDPSFGNSLGELTTASLGSGDGSTSTYFSGPAAILKRTGGLVFPHTPNIQITHTATWEDYDLTHTNYGYYAYKNSKVDNFTVSGKFTSNTLAEAAYLIGCIHFLRSVTKMHFGENDEFPGTPPPVLEFSAMGPQLFNKVPIVITNFQSSFEDIYDYVSGGTRTVDGSVSTFVPTTTNITVSMLIYHNPSSMQIDFTLRDFKKGALLRNGWI